MLTVGSLFSGIGGLDLGLERAGLRVLWQCESDPYCRAVLRKHWPDIPCYEDVKALAAYAERDQLWVQQGRRRSERSAGLVEEWARTSLAGVDGATQPLAVDVLCGGFPCQPVSLAGRRRGAADERWLWPEFARLIRVLRPRYVLAENVPGLLVGGGMAEVLGALAACGYDAEWDCIPAAAVGAPHLRYRVFIVAVAHDDGGHGRAPWTGEAQVRPTRHAVNGCPPDGHELLSDADPGGWDGRARIFGQGWRRQPTYGGWWAVEPDVGRVAHGVPSRVDRLRALGNAVVPQVAEAVGRMIVRAGEGRAA